MQFITDRDALNEAVNIVQKAAAVKSAIPALEGILIETRNDILHFTAYDLNVSIDYELSASIEEEGSIVLPARLFSDIVRKLPSSNIEIKTDEKLHVHIASGASEFTIMGIDTDEFPEISPPSQQNRISIDINAFKRLVRQTIFAAAQNDLKPVLTGVLFKPNTEEKSICAVAVDGFRLAIKKESYEDLKGQSNQFIVPMRTLSELLKILPDTEDKILNILIGDKNITFVFEQMTLTSRLLEGEFLNYESAIPQNCVFKVTVPVREFSQMIERASLLTSSTIKSPIRCEFDIASIKVTTSSNIGKFCDEIKTEQFNQQLIIGFNHKYMLDALGACDESEVVFELTNPLSPIVIKPCEGDGFLFMVLPVRLNLEA